MRNNALLSFIYTKVHADHDKHGPTEELHINETLSLEYLLCDKRNDKCNTIYEGHGDTQITGGHHKIVQDAAHLVQEERN